MSLQAFSTILATWSGLWLAASLLISLLYPLFANKLAPIEPSQRAWLLRLLALTAPAFSVLTCIELFIAPGKLVPLHCHLSNCTAHNPDTQTSFIFAKEFLLVVFVPIVLISANVLLSTIRLSRQWHHLSTATQAYRFLDSSHPIACVVGLLRPTIYFSRGFIAGLSPTALRVVIAHERAHASRYDNLWIVIVRIFSLGWIYRQRLLDDLELAQEQACDQMAAIVVGDAITVAETLVQCQRLAQTPQISCAFMRGQLQARVQTLLDAKHTVLSPLTLLRFGSVALLLATGLVTPLHYAIELL